MKRQFINFESEKILVLSIENEKLISETGKEGKLRTTEKAFASTEEVLAAFDKKEWENLKKGFVYHNENAQTGEPILHKFISRGYTGALSFAQTPKGFFIYEAGEYDGKKEEDFMQQIDLQGRLLNRFQLPKILAWEMKYNAETDEIMMNLDHISYRFRLEDEVFEKVKEKIKNTSPYGKFWAEESKGQIKVFETETGNLKGTIKTGFQKVKDILFSDNYLIANDFYWDKGMKFFDLQTLEEVKREGFDIAEKFPVLQQICLSPDQKYLAQQRVNFVYVFDFQNGELLYKFPIEHLVKTCQMQFVAEGLAIRTDYGCFSVYKIG